MLVQSSLKDNFILEGLIESAVTHTFDKVILRARLISNQAQGVDEFQTEVVFQSII